MAIKSREQGRARDALGSRPRPPGGRLSVLRQQRATLGNLTPIGEVILFHGEVLVPVALIPAAGGHCNITTSVLRVPSLQGNARSSNRSEMNLRNAATSVRAVAFLLLS